MSTNDTMPENTKETLRSTTPTNKDLECLMNERTELWKTLRELNTDDDDSANEELQSFDPSSIEKMGTKLSILRDLDEEQDKGKKRKCLAKLSQVKNTLKIRSSEQNDDKKDSALDLILDDSDISSCEQSNSDEYSGRIDEHCSEMKPNGKHDEYSDSDDNNPRTYKRRRVSGSKQNKSANSTPTKSEHKSNTKEPPSGSTNAEPYTRRLRSHLRENQESKQNKRRKVTRRSRRRRRSKSSHYENAQNTNETSTEKQANQHRKIDSEVISAGCTQATEDLHAAQEVTETSDDQLRKNVIDDGSCQQQTGVFQSTEAVNKTDTVPNQTTRDSGKWAETCERIFKGDMQKEEECLFDGYTKTTEAAKPCQDPTQWLNTLIRLNQKGKDASSSALADKSVQLNKRSAQSSLQPATGTSGHDMQTPTDQSSINKEDLVLSKQDEDSPHTEGMLDQISDTEIPKSSSVVKSPQSTDMYVSHPKYPAMPPGMKIKRTSSTGNHPRSERRSQDDGSTSSSGSTPQTLSKEEVSQLVSKLLKICDPSKPEEQAKTEPAKKFAVPTTQSSSMTRESQLHGHVITPRRNAPTDPRSRYPEPYKKHSHADKSKNADPRLYNRNTGKPIPVQHTARPPIRMPNRPVQQTTRPIPPLIHQIPRHISTQHTAQGRDSYDTYRNPFPHLRINTPAQQMNTSIGGSMGMFGATGGLNIDGVDSNMRLAAEDNFHAQINHDAKKLQIATSPRVRTDSASSTSDSVILSPTHQTPSPLTSPSYVSPEVVNRDPRKYSPASSSYPGRDIKASKVQTDKPVLDASLAIEKDMSESRTNINRLWETTICTSKKINNESIQRDLNEKLDMTSKNDPTQRSKRVPNLEARSQQGVHAKDEPWNFIVYDIEVPHGTCYKKIDDYGKSKKDPRLKPRQLTLDGNEEHIGRRLTKHTSKIPLAYTNKPEIIKPTSRATRTEKGGKLTDSREHMAEGTEPFHKSPVCNEKPATSSVCKDKLPQVTATKADPNEDKSGSIRSKGLKAGSMWSSLLGNERRPTRPDDNDILTEGDIGECDETTRNAMKKVWDLSNLEWASLNTEMLDILQDRVSQIDDAMVFNDPTKGLTADRRRKLIASENINGRVAKELKIESDMQQLYEKINHLRERADIWQQTGTPEEKLTELRKQIKVLDVRYEKYFKELEELNRFHKSNVLEVLPEMFRLPEEAKKFISVEGNMLFLISTLNEMDCKKLFALREEIVTQKALINASEAPYIDRQQAKLRLGWLHGERKEALCEICINMLSNKESVVQKFSSRILWSRKGEQALRDTGSSDDLLNYIQQRIHSLEIYLKVLRCVQRTENGVWMPCRVSSNRSVAERKEGRREQAHIEHHRRSIEAVTPDPFKSTSTKCHEPEKACDFTFPDSILSRKIPGIDSKDDLMTAEDTSITSMHASKSNNLGKRNPANRVSSSQFNEQEKTNSMKINDQPSDSKEEKKKPPTTPVSSQPSECEATPFDIEIDRSLVIDEDPEKSHGIVEHASNLNTDDVKISFPNNQYGNTSSVQVKNSSSSMLLENANSPAEVKHATMATEDTRKSDRGGFISQADNEVSDNTTAILLEENNKTPLADLTNERTRSKDTKNQEPSDDADGVQISQASANISLGSVDARKVEIDPNSSTPYTASGEGEKVIVDSTLTSESTRKDVNEHVSKILSLLKACQKTCEASTRTDQFSTNLNPQLDCISTLNAAFSSSSPTMSKQPQPTPKSDIDDPPAEDCRDNTNLHDMDISDISDSPRIEVCLPPSGSVCQSYGDMDWRPIMEPNRTLVDDSRELGVACEGQSHSRDKNVVTEGPLNNNNAQLNSKEQSMASKQNDTDMRKQGRTRSRWDVKPNELTCTDSVSSADPATTNIVEKRTITVDNTPWRSGNHSRSDHTTTPIHIAQSISKDGETRPTHTPLEILAKANLFKKASDLVEHSASSPQSMEIDPDACTEHRSSQLQSRNLKQDRHCDRIVTITKSRSADNRGCSPSSITHSDGRSCSTESDSRFDVDDRSFSRSRSRSPPGSRRRKHHQHDAVQNRVLEQSTSNAWNSEGSNRMGMMASDRHGSQDRAYHQLSFKDPTIRRILSGDPVLIDMLSHPTSATRLASMLPNVQDRETVFKLAREVQHDLGQISDDQH